jgi:hypothetical protein
MPVGSGESQEFHRFSAGLSLLDIGWIRFNKAVQVHEFNDVTDKGWGDLNNFHPKTLQYFFRSASQNLLGDSLASLTDQSSFTIFLPAGISLQGQYYIGYNLFANMVFVQGIRLSHPDIRRPSLIGLIPRYETRVWEVDLPFSLVDYKYPQVGLSIRVFNLVIGTERLGTFLNLSDVRGMDLYFSLGLSLDPKKRDWRYKQGKFAPCESYENYNRFRVKNTYK